ncbi:MAG: hypothetical protein K0S30_147 [Clostridia bacterium]|jgi:hypothetical protein|nr:hypothetical protein [Clostridia bacterium]
MKREQYSLHTKENYLDLFININTPLLKYLSPGCAGIHYGKTGVGYGNKLAACEGFARFLWGAGPALTSMKQETVIKDIITGIKNGTNPGHEEYWGIIGDRDQRMVEMPAIALTLMYQEQKIWKCLSKEEQGNAYNWLNQLNDHECADGNWQFFRVIVNLVLKKLGYPVNTLKQKEALDKIEACYLKDGWYRDSSRGRQDYYTPFAFHYYGLLYAVLEPHTPEAETFRERAKLFATQYIHFFAENGANIPFGRSMVYRYAVVSFWSALVYGKVLPFSLGEIKGIINRNIRWWMTQDIFSEEGILTLGYTYPQLMLTEPYNAPLSPYWSNKIFLLLALDAEHPYWQAEEEPLPKRESIKLLGEVNMLAFHDYGHSQLLSAGQPGPNFHVLSNEKYLKFSYSGAFGFSIPRSNELKTEAAMDSMIGIQSAKGNVLTWEENQPTFVTGQYKVRNCVEQVAKTDNYLTSRWCLADGNKIKTWLMPIGSWQVRVHQLYLTEESMIYETGFALESASEDTLYTYQAEEKGYYAKSSKGFSGIKDLTHHLQKRENRGVNCLPNTNLMTPEVTTLPGFEVKLSAGEHWLATGIMAHPDSQYAELKWKNTPEVYIEKDWIIIKLKEEVLTIGRNEGEKGD